MPQPTRPGDGSDRAFSARDPQQRAAPTSRINIPFNQPGQSQQYAPQQLQQYRQHQMHQQQERRRVAPDTVARMLRPDTTNYTSQRIRYQIPGITMPRVMGAPGLHAMHPLWHLRGQKPGLLPREMASDMMEAMFLGDPGYFLSLNDGVKYFIWRRTVLKLQGKHPLTGRLFPHFPVFNFDFRSPFLLRDPRTNKQYTVTSQVIRQTYAYFYSCWRRNAFPSSQDETPNNGQEPNNFNQQPDKPNGQSFHMFLLHSKFWDQFGPVVAENSVQGARLRNDVIHNLITHLDIAFQGVRSHKIKDKDDALAYIEASAEFWSDPNWRHPEGYIPTPDYHRIVVHVQQIPLVYPYAISVDFHVREREPRFKPAHVQSPPKEYITIVEHEDCVRPVTAEEAEFLDQFISYDAELNVDKDVEMEEEARHDTPSVVMTDLDMGLEPMVFML